MTALRHQAMLYEGTDEFLAAALPFVSDGVAAGDPVIAVAHTPNVAALREALGADGAAVELVESQDWYHSPGRAFGGFLGFAQANPDAACVRMIGEPIWPLGWEAAVAEYAHYESVFNVIAGEAPIWALCPYDTVALPDAILDHALHTHPEVCTYRGGVAPSDRFTDPETYCAHLAGRTVLPGVRARRFPVTHDLAALRRSVEQEAVHASVDPRNVGPFMLAVHEAAANALTHGGGDASARTWIEDRTFVCEIADRGPGLSETVAGYVPPEGEAHRGRGLWMTRQVCDLVEVQSREGDTRVRLHVRRG
ncbi:MAG TPA: sensor histidine kinase [Gaiellaceae bacterium]|nr:sensor histidine kinase [Gaiellaceae bacterium]